MFAPLKTEEVERIHCMSLDVLKNTGIEVNSDKALVILRDGGARIDQKNNRVYLPPPLVENALRNVPKSFVIYGRKEEIRGRFARGNPPLFGSAGAPIIIYDLNTSVRREAELRDFVSMIKLLDGLPNVDLVTPVCSFTGIPEEAREISTLFQLVNNTQKPFSMQFIGEVGFKEAITFIGLLKEIVFGGKTFLLLEFSPMIGPLWLDKIVTDQLIRAVEADIPICPTIAAQPGMTAPSTLAGTLIIMNAEILALMVLSQITKPGAPFLYCAMPGMTNFRTANTLTASPELPLLNAAATQLAEYYGLPNWATAGRTDSKLLDIQAGYEQSFAVPWAVLSGATYISAIGGFLESVCALAFEKFVIDDEIVGMTKRVLKGIETDDDHCAVNLISSVGPGGNFLTEEHTLLNMRREFFIPSVTEISSWNEWNGKGRPTALEKARQKAKDIITSHSAPPLPDNVIGLIKDAFPDIVMADGRGN